MEIEAAAMLVPLDPCRQGTVAGLRAKTSYPHVSIAEDIWVSTLSYFKARQLFIVKKAGKLFNRPNQHKPHNAILPSTLANIEGRRRMQS